MNQSLDLTYQDLGQVPCILIKDKSVTLRGMLFVYHGWTNNKEESIELGVQIAKQGFLAVLPEAYQHGVRANQPLQDNNFVDVIWKTFLEFTDIYQDIQTQYANLPVGVCGISMGAILSGMILTGHEFVKHGAILMGTLKLHAFLDGLSQMYNQQSIDQSLNQMGIPQQILSYDLSQNLECIKDKQIYIWHAKNDGVVPYGLQEAFLSQVNEAGLREHLIVDFWEEGGHRVPFAIKMATGQFFDQYL